MVVSNGAKHSIHNALMAVCGPGRRGDHPRALLGQLLRPGQADRRDAGRDPDHRGAGIQADARAVPGGRHAADQAAHDQQPVEPDGRGLRSRRAEALADAVLETDVGVLSDEIYEQLTYGDARPTCFATLRPGLAERTITISGVSKTYAMTGWRIGWAVAPAPVAKFMGDIQSQETSNPCSISQWAALEAITGPQDSVASMKAEFQKRRDYVLERISRLPGGRPACRRAGRSTPS